MFFLSPADYQIDDRVGFTRKHSSMAFLSVAFLSVFSCAAVRADDAAEIDAVERARQVMLSSTADNSSSADVASRADKITDYAILLYRHSDRSLAKKMYEEALSISGRNWRARLGLAQCLAFEYALSSRDQPSAPQGHSREQARLELEAAAAAAQSPLALLYCAETARTMDETEKALRWYKQAKTLIDSEKSGSAVDTNVENRRRRLSIKLSMLSNSFNLEDARAFLPVCEDEELACAILTRMSGLESEPGVDVAMLAKKWQNSFRVQLALALLKGGDEAAKTRREKCLLRAIELAPYETAPPLALAASYDDAGRHAAALTILRQAERRNLQGEPGATRTSRAKLYAAALDLLSARSDLARAARLAVGGVSEGGNANLLRISRAELKDWRCHCNMTSMRQQLMHKPGVIYAHLQFADPGVATVIFRPDAATSSGHPRYPAVKNIWSAASSQAQTRVFAEDETVSSFAQLARVLLSCETALYKPVAGIPQFETPPLVSESKQ